MTTAEREFNLWIDTQYLATPSAAPCGLPAPHGQGQTPKATPLSRPMLDRVEQAVRQEMLLINRSRCPLCSDTDRLRATAANVAVGHEPTF
jgi:hypothetical protein